MEVCEIAHLEVQTLLYTISCMHCMTTSLAQGGMGWGEQKALEFLKSAGFANVAPEPVNLLELKSEILKRWPMTSLLDMLKETDLRTDFKGIQERNRTRVSGSDDVAEAPLAVLVWAAHKHRTEARKYRSGGRKLP
jgi:hypothetical protein